MLAVGGGAFTGFGAFTGGNAFTGGGGFTVGAAFRGISIPDMGQGICGGGFTRGGG